MADGIWSAASGALAQLRQLDVTANNVANASTLGYKADNLAFREVLGRANASEKLRHCRVDQVAADMTPGTLIQTGRAMDVSLRNRGYVAVRAEGQERYTRVGNFQLSTNGSLRTAEGHEVLGADGKPIRLPAGTLESDVAIGEDGGVTVRGAQTAQVRVVSFKNEQALQKAGGPLFAATAESGRPVLANGEFEAGTLEGSNVSVVRGMVDIVNASRAFEACQKVMEAFRSSSSRGAPSVISPK